MEWGAKAGQDAGDAGLRCEGSDLRIAVRSDSREGTGDFSPDLERLPLDDRRLEAGDAPRKGALRGCGLGESACVTMRTGM